jgi:hypothetical protein
MNWLCLLYSSFHPTFELRCWKNVFYLHAVIPNNCEVKCILYIVVCQLWEPIWYLFSPEFGCPYISDKFIVRVKVTQLIFRSPSWSAWMATSCVIFSDASRYSGRNCTNISSRGFTILEETVQKSYRWTRLWRPRLVRHLSYDVIHSVYQLISHKARAIPYCIVRHNIHTYEHLPRI